MGDLNMAGNLPSRITGYRSLARHPTFPLDHPDRQLDHILLRGELGQVTSSSAPALPLSDHRALVVDLDPTNGAADEEGDALITTDHYIRFERVDSVTGTSSGLLAQLHREQLKIDIVSARPGPDQDQPWRGLRRVADLRGLRRSTRGAGAVHHRTRCADRVLLITESMTVTLWLDPFRIDVHRADGSAVIETAQDSTGPLLGVRDAERRVHHPPPLPPGGRDLRPGREVRPAQPQGPRLHHVERRRAEPGGDRGVHPRQGRRRSARRPDQRRSSIRSTPPSRSSTTRTTPPAAMAASFVDNGYRGAYEFSEPEEYRIVFDGGQYTEYVFAGPDMPAILTAVHLADRADGAAAAVGARLPPVPLVRLHPGRRRGDRRPPPRGRHPLRRHVAGHRVHGRLPGLHLGHRAVPGRRRECWNGLPTTDSG